MGRKCITEVSIVNGKLKKKVYFSSISHAERLKKLHRPYVITATVPLRTDLHCNYNYKANYKAM